MSDALEKLGFDAFFRDACAERDRADVEPGRVVEAHLDTYSVRTGDALYRADIAGNLRYTFLETSDFPTVGDWVLVATFDEGYAVVHHVLPRRSALARQATSRRSDKQIIGANIDTALIMQAAKSDFNLNRLDRYVAAAYGSAITPVLLLSKVDLLAPEALAARVSAIGERHPGLEIIAISSVSAEGFAALNARLEAEKTYCLLGSSGVGKSTLLNALMGQDILATQEISGWNQRGKHTTSSRALFVLPSGAIFIDTPGMRELAVAEGDTGLEKTFDDIYALAETCRFGDCRHEDEPGCAVQAALESGALDANKFDNFCKMKREATYFEASAAAKRKKARSQGKLYKRIKNEKRSQRF